ncbi:hypothetical protein FAIPA1_80113 [Frankia sp. AiPs1]
MRSGRRRRGRPARCSRPWAARGAPSVEVGAPELGVQETGLDRQLRGVAGVDEILQVARALVEQLQLADEVLGRGGAGDAGAVGVLRWQCGEVVQSLRQVLVDDRGQAAHLLVAGRLALDVEQQWAQDVVDVAHGGHHAGWQPSAVGVDPGDERGQFLAQLPDPRGYVAAAGPAASWIAAGAGLTRVTLGGAGTPTEDHPASSRMPITRVAPRSIPACPRAVLPAGSASRRSTALRRAAERAAQRSSARARSR